MDIRELHIQHFRGFSELVLKPMGHVVLMGEAGAGRSDIVEALSRVLDADARRTRTSNELDFNCMDTSQPVIVGLTIGGLGEDLEQNFFDYLEIWDSVEKEIILDSESPETINGAAHEWVLRLEYRAEWQPDEERCEERVYYPKASDPEVGEYRPVRFRDLEAIGFAHLRWGMGRLLDLGPRSTFRRIIERSSGSDFATAVANYVQEVATAAAQFTESAQVKAALDELLNPLRDLLRIGEKEAYELFRFAPEGGSPSGLLRSLGPAVDLDDGSGSLPAWRRGSTIASLFRIAEAFALSSESRNILAIDDLGDGIDAASAAHLASVMRQFTGQVWITTRAPAVAEIFEPQEVIRLGRTPDGSRFAWQGRTPTKKAEKIAATHWHRNLLPALSYRSVVVLEGPNDFAAFHALSIRLSNEAGDLLPATRGVCIINAGFTGSGGYPSVLRLAGAARQMGLRAVGVIDGDTRADAVQFLEDNSSLADAVVRLPDNAEIEAALVRDVPESILRQSLTEAAASAYLMPPQELDQLSGRELERAAVSFIKKHSLHALLVEALPATNLPPLAVKVLHRALETAVGDATGIIQL